MSDGGSQQPEESSATQGSSSASPAILLEPGPKASLSEWNAYYKQQINTLQKREELNSQERVKNAEEGRIRAETAALAMQKKANVPFAIKSYGKTPSEYSGGTWQDWDQYVTEMESQFKQNNVDNVSEEPVRSQRKVAYAETFLRKSPQTNWKNKLTELRGKELSWQEYKDFLLSQVERFEQFQEDMQVKYRKLKQGETEKVKKYAERVDVILGRLEVSRRTGPAGELQDFLHGLRTDHQVELYKHPSYTNRKDLIDAVTRLETAEYIKKKEDKPKDKDKSKRGRDDGNDDSKPDSKKPKPESKDKEKKKDDKGVKDLTERLYRWGHEEYARHVKEGNCLGCGKKGHGIKDCTEKKKPTKTKKEAFKDPEESKN